VIQIVNNITILAIILTGTALLREREHGTLDHLLVLPLTALEIMLAKIWSNALVVVVHLDFAGWWSKGRWACRWPARWGCSWP
jgi:ABC-type transport system involved in multi-copper enzyme maturation permease subunit